jgi:hypothetical protein
VTDSCRIEFSGSARHSIAVFIFAVRINRRKARELPKLGSPESR